VRKFKPFLFPAAGLLFLLTLTGCGSNNGTTLTLHSTGNYSVASLKGAYVYQIHGTTVSGPYRELGVFTADGAGNITSGSDDFDAGAISPSNPTGSYQVSSDGTGFIALNSTGLGQNNGVTQITLAITLVSASKVNLIEADAFAEAAGVAELQTATTMPAGPFVFRSHQIAFNSSQSPVAEVGAINISSGALTGNLDQNLGGTSNQLTVTGTLATPAATGRGTGNFTDSTNATTNFVYYVVSSGKFVFMITTPGDVGSGSAEAQSGTVTNGLAGSYAFGSRGDITTSYDAVATVGQITVAGGAISSGTIESMLVGVYSSPLAITGTATPTTSTNGRVAVTFSSSAGTVQQVFWMVSPSRAFFLTNDPNTVEDGTADLQTISSFSASTMKGQYSLVMDGLDFVNQQLLSRIGPLQLDGAGKATLNELTNTGAGATSPGGLTGPYQVSSNGRVAVALGGGFPNFVMYAISGSDAYTLQIDGGENISGMVNLQN
jgi:hypothetical protein